MLLERLRGIFLLPGSDQISGEPRPIYSTSTDSDSVPINQTSANVLRAQYHQQVLFSPFDFSKFESPAEIISRLLAHGSYIFSGGDIFPFTIRDERNGNSIQLR